MARTPSTKIPKRRRSGGDPVGMTAEPGVVRLAKKRRAVRRSHQLAAAARSTAKLRAAQLGDTIAEEGRQRVNEAKHGVEFAAGSLDEIVRKKPVQALAVALAAGMLLGLMTRGR